jgi:hypothetical protein
MKLGKLVELGNAMNREKVHSNCTLSFGFTGCPYMVLSKEKLSRL